MHAARYRA